MYGPQLYISFFFFFNIIRYLYKNSMFIQNRGLGYIYTFNLPALKNLVNRLMEHT